MRPGTTIFMNHFFPGMKSLFRINTSSIVEAAS